jgi:aspartyl-tRNA(Asn)/glutamyl-tRNA(Gln) amidotransferase subunit B
LPAHDVKVYLQSRQLFDFFELAREHLSLATPKDMSKWIVGELNALLKESMGELNMSPTVFASLIDRLAAGNISTKMVKDMLPKLLDGKASLDDVISAMGGAQISNQNELQQVVNAVLKANPDVVEKIKNGKTASANFLMGQVMKETKGRAKPDTVRDLIISACQGE